MSNILPRSFYARKPEIVARELLGKILVRKLEGKISTGRIVETEAYLASGDEAAHSFKGKTKRNESLYKKAGHAYVHRMRQYFLIDIVTEAVDIPSSVLIRAVEPLENIDRMKSLRGVDSVQDIANGPGKVCIAFEIDMRFDGADLTTLEAPFYIAEGEKRDDARVIGNSGRIGISHAREAPLRFWIKGNTYTSRKH